jgi:hypothetical protein
MTDTIIGTPGRIGILLTLYGRDVLSTDTLDGDNESDLVSHVLDPRLAEETDRSIETLIERLYERTAAAWRAERAELRERQVSETAP